MFLFSSISWLRSFADLSWDLPALLLGHGGALLLGYILTAFLVDQVAQLLGNIVALFIGGDSALVCSDALALLSWHLFGCILAGLRGNITALLLFHILATFLGNNLTLLLGDVLADFVLNIVAIISFYSLALLTGDFSWSVLASLSLNVAADLSWCVNTSFLCGSFANLFRDALALLSWNNVTLLH